MLALENMLKELGTVTIHYGLGKYQAACGRAFDHREADPSDSVSGAVWNALRLKRESDERDCLYATQRAALLPTD